MSTQLGSRILNKINTSIAIEIIFMKFKYLFEEFNANKIMQMVAWSIHIYCLKTCGIIRNLSIAKYVYEIVIQVNLKHINNMYVAMVPISAHVK